VNKEQGVRMKQLAIGVAILIIFITVISTNSKPVEKLSYKEAAIQASQIMELMMKQTGAKYSETQYEFVINKPHEALERLNHFSFLPEGDQIMDSTSYDDFVNAMAFRESSNDWTVVNQLGYIGLFQFGRLALADIDMEINPEDFKKDPSIFSRDQQLDAFNEWTQVLYRYTRNHINRYEGRTINGIEVTTSGIIAGAHLVGHGGVKTWLDSNGTTDVKDGNGVCVSEYMEQFAGYDIKDSVSPETIVLAMN